MSEELKIQKKIIDTTNYRELPIGVERKSRTYEQHERHYHFKKIQTGMKTRLMNIMKTAILLTR